MGNRTQFSRQSFHHYGMRVHSGPFMPRKPANRRKASAFSQARKSKVSAQLAKNKREELRQEGLDGGF